MSEVRDNARVLLVDDTATTLEQLADLLRASGFVVEEANSAWRALNVLRELGQGISFVLVDQVLDGAVDGGTKVAREIAKLRPDIFIVMYTADAQIDGKLRWEALNAGAHRYIRKSSAAELLQDFDEFIEDMAELRDLTGEINDMIRARRSMFSVLAGLDVQLSIIDREYRVWFTSRDQGSRVLSGVRCWTLFHGYPASHGPCFGCLIRSVIETNRSQTRTLIRPSDLGELEWFRHDAMPVRRFSSSSLNRVMAVRETTQKIEHSEINLNVKERLGILAASVVHYGYGRARIYRATGRDRIRCEAAATRYSQEDDLQYKDEAIGFETEASNNIYVRRALDEVHGTLVESIDADGLDPASRMNIRQEPPWIDIPIWREQGGEQDLVGWLSVDLVGLPNRTLSKLDIDKLRPFREEIQRTIIGRVNGQESVNEFRQVLAEARSALVSARGEDEALTHLVRFAEALVGGAADVLDVRVRVRQDGRLRLLKRLNVGLRPTEEVISENDPKSLAAYVVRFGNDLFIRDLEDYEREARSGNELPPGLVPRYHNALAILRAKFGEQVFGTLHIECRGLLNWELVGLREPLRELAEMAAFLLRDIVQNGKLEVAREAAEKQLAQAFGAIHGIKGPVQACRSYLETIAVLHKQKKLTSARAVELAGKAEIGLGRIERLAVRLLNLVRERTDEVKSVDVEKALSDCVKVASVICPAIRVSYFVSSAVREIIFNEAEFSAVIEELITNSARAEASEVYVDIEDANDWWTIKVEDDGRGVQSKEEAERIFERWYHTFAGGAGLGLASVRKSVEDIGGKVWAEQRAIGLRIVMLIPKVSFRAS